MTRAATTEKPRGSPHVMPLLDDFFDAVRDENPFRANRVTEPSSYDIDVPAIHGVSFDQLTKLAGVALRARQGIGAILLGGSGIGKSHLLSRLYRWAAQQDQNGGPRACYVYLHNILADPDRLPRYLLKYVVSRLTDGGQGLLHQTPLYRLVDQAVHHAVASAGVVANTIRDEHEAFVSSLKPAVGRTVPHFLSQFRRHARPEKANDPVRRRVASEAIAWLSGDEINPAAAPWLGLRVHGQEPMMLRDDHEVEQVLLALAQLAEISAQPFVLCIDQVDNIDADKLQSLARFLHALLDHAANLLIITSGVKQTLLAYKDDQTIPDAAWDRLAQYQVDLLRVTKHDARKILEARLERFLEPFLEVDEVRKHLRDDTLFPLGRAWLEGQFGAGIDFRPRDVLTWARDDWERQQAQLARLGGETWIQTWPIVADGEIARDDLSREDLQKAIDEAVGRKVEEQVAQHRLHPGSLPPDAGNLTALVESLLGHCHGAGLPYTFLAVERMTKRAGRLPPYDLLVHECRESDGQEVATGVLFVTNVGRSATAALRRLLEDTTPPDHRILVTDHERGPLKVGPQGVAYYHALEKLGLGKFEHLKIDFEQYAILDALCHVIGMARSGDLEIEAPKGTIRPVTEAEVIASHHRQDRYRTHPVLRPLLTEDPPPVPPPKPPHPLTLDENDVRQYVMAQLAWMMGSTAQAIARSYVGSMPALRVSPEEAWPQVKAIAGRMHTEGLVHAQPLDNDLYLLLRK
jgi:hypothetical protein